MSAMDVEDDITIANNGHPVNLLQISCQEIIVEAQIASLFGEDVPIAELLRQEGAKPASGRVDTRALGPYFCPVSGCSRNLTKRCSRHIGVC